MTTFKLIKSGIFLVLAGMSGWMALQLHMGHDLGAASLLLFGALNIVMASLELIEELYK